MVNFLVPTIGIEIDVPSKQCPDKLGNANWVCAIVFKQKQSVIINNEYLRCIFFKTVRSLLRLF